MVWTRKWNEVHLQEPTQEHEYDADFAPAIHFEVLKHSHRQCDDDEVKNDVDSSGAPSVRVQVDAPSVMLTVPVLPCNANRNTLQRSC